jgi:hypothetical protein
MNNTEKNILIAEFMGVDEVDIDTWLENNSDLKYHNSWDWLMPVIKKLDSLANEKFTFAEFDDYRIQWAMIDKPSKYPIERVYEQVVEFIEHLNKVK